MNYRPHMLPKVRCEALRDACVHMPCTVRIASFIPGFTCASDETVVGAHLPIFGKGTSTKVTDTAIVAACLHCHALLDGADKRGLVIAEQYPAAFYERLLHATHETIVHWVLQGAIEFPTGRMELV